MACGTETKTHSEMCGCKTLINGEVLSLGLRHISLLFWRGGWCWHWNPIKALKHFCGYKFIGCFNQNCMWDESTLKLTLLDWTFYWPLNNKDTISVFRLRPQPIEHPRLFCQMSVNREHIVFFFHSCDPVGSFLYHDTAITASVRLVGRIPLRRSLAKWAQKRLFIDKCQS